MTLHSYKRSAKLIELTTSCICGILEENTCSLHAGIRFWVYCAGLWNSHLLHPATSIPKEHSLCPWLSATCLLQQPPSHMHHQCHPVFCLGRVLCHDQHRVPSKLPVCGVWSSSPNAESLLATSSLIWKTPIPRPKIGRKRCQTKIKVKLKKLIGRFSCISLRLQLLLSVSRKQPTVRRPTAPRIFHQFPCFRV